MAHAYTEDQLVEQPAIGLFAQLGWQTVSASEEVFGAGGTLGRETPGDVVLVPRLRGALERLNPAMPPDAISAAVDQLTRDRSAMLLAAANREVYLLLKDGIMVSLPDRERGGQKTERLRVIDWQNPEANDFLLVSQFSVTGLLYTCRPDLVAFINGLPLVVIELKKPGVPARVAFDENLTHYKQEIPSLFWFNALLIASNGTDSRVGSLTADWGRFFEWKRIEREDEPRHVSLERMIRGTCDRVRLLDLVENFALFSEHKAGLVICAISFCPGDTTKAKACGAVSEADSGAAVLREPDARVAVGESRSANRERATLSSAPTTAAPCLLNRPLQTEVFSGFRAFLRELSAERRERLRRNIGLTFHSHQTLHP